jgi:hypothetical protein
MTGKAANYLVLFSNQPSNNPRATPQIFSLKSLDNY